MRDTPDKAFFVEDQRRLPVFIHSEIDDSGLDVYERAVYLTMSRRAGANGRHWESINNMAVRLGIGRTKAKEVLRALERYGLIVRTDNPGYTNRYHLTDREHWRLPPPRGTRSPGDWGVVATRLGTRSPGDHEGTPYEGTPN